MRQRYYCPDCGALVFCGDRFCGNCGASLNWVLQNTPAPVPPLSDGYQCPEQQQAWCQQVGRYEQPGRDLQTLDGQESASGSLNQCKHQYRDGSRGTAALRKSSSQDSDVTPISIEISRLLADFFEKHSKRKKIA